jgi:hypothetical protein
MSKQRRVCGESSRLFSAVKFINQTITKQSKTKQNKLNKQARINDIINMREALVGEQESGGTFKFMQKTAHLACKIAYSLRFICI